MHAWRSTGDLEPSWGREEEKMADSPPAPRTATLTRFAGVDENDRFESVEMEREANMAGRRKDKGKVGRVEVLGGGRGADGDLPRFRAHHPLSCPDAHPHTVPSQTRLVSENFQLILNMRSSPRQEQDRSSWLGDDLA